MKKIISIVIFIVFGLYVNIRAGEKIDFPEYPGWDLSTDFPVYSPDNLWDYINGAADGYLSYAFKNLIMAEYSKGKYNIKVEVYNHKDDKNAFGIYTSERSPDYNFLDIGAEGYQQGSILNFLAGDKYIKIHADSDKKSVIKAMIGIAKDLSENLSHNGDFPKMLEHFPQKNKIPYRQKFIAQNFLGHGFFNDVFTVDYEVNGEKFTLFLTEKSSPEKCKLVIENYFEFTGQDIANINQGRYLINDQYNGDIHLVWDDNIIYGIYDCEDKELINEYLNLFSY